MAGNKKYFTDRTLKALPPAKRGERYEIWTASFPALVSASVTRETITDQGKRAASRLFITDASRIARSNSACPRPLRPDDA